MVHLIKRNERHMYSRNVVHFLYGLNVLALNFIFGFVVKREATHKYIYQLNFASQFWFNY